MKPGDEVRDVMVLIRLNQREADLLDSAKAAAGHTERSAFVRETVLARARGAQAVVPGAAPATIRSLAGGVGAWKALGGPDYDAVKARADRGDGAAA